MKLETSGGIIGFVGDGNGHVTGQRPSLPKYTNAETIPGGSYNATHKNQSFFFNDDGLYVGEFEVVAKGSIQLDIQNYAGSEARAEAVFHIEAPVGAKLDIRFASEQNLENLSLRVDLDGNGTVDRTASPTSILRGEATGETYPPKTAIAFAKARQRRVEVSLFATDEPNGSGISDTFYMLRSDKKSRLYKEPFLVASRASVRFLSVDRAGNVEPIHNVTVPTTK